MAKYLDLDGLQSYTEKIKEKFDEKANTDHAHSAIDITSGTLTTDRLPVIPDSKGGTGQTSLNASANTLINSLTLGTSVPTDNDYYVSQYVGGGTSIGTYHRRSISALWSYMKGKADDIYCTETEVNNKLANMNKEAYIEWGGRNFSEGFSPIDATLVPELGANRLAFMPPEAITIQYSTNGGSTWSDYSTNDGAKVQLFSGINTSFYIGGSSQTGIDKTNHKLRIIINTGVANVYTVLNKFVINISTNGSSGCTCTIDVRTEQNRVNNVNTWETKANNVSISGWSGYNVINVDSITTYGNAPSTQYGQIRFTFSATGHNQNYSGLKVISIQGFGGVGWDSPSTMARYGRIFTYDWNKNVTFPANLSATTLIENGTALSSKYLSKTGGTISGSLTIGNGNGVGAEIFRSDTSLRAGQYYHCAGNEAMIFANTNPVTSWIFANVDPTQLKSWQSLGVTPAMQIKNNKVVINKFIANDANANFNLDVGGSANATTMSINGEVKLEYDSTNKCLNFNFE